MLGQTVYCNAFCYKFILNDIKKLFSVSEFFIFYHTSA
jgi:hypothetical protein